MSQEIIETARDQLAAGKVGRAVGTLSDIVEMTSDPEELRQIHALALEGLEQAGRFGKGPWRHVLGLAEKRLEVTPA